jgi:hypothetical protein
MPAGRAGLAQQRGQRGLYRIQGVNMSSRQLDSSQVQKSVRHLNNFLCRHRTPTELAQVSSHRRNYSVAEMIAVLGQLDSHPTIKSRPTVARDAAAFQQMKGSTDNHFSHVAPCNILLNGRMLTTFFSTPKAQQMIRRIFGGGLLAPDNWNELGTFSQQPAEQNRTDCIVEKFKTSHGLVAAFESTLQAAAASGKWQGSGKHQHNRTSLIDFVEQFQRHVWRPAAEEAYETALTDLKGQLVAAKSSSAESRAKLLAQRIEIVEVQLLALVQNPINPSNATYNVLQDTAGEVWKT